MIQTYLTFHRISAPRAGDVGAAAVQTCRSKQCKSLVAVISLEDKYCLIDMHYQFSTIKMDSPYSSPRFVSNHCSDRQTAINDQKIVLLQHKPHQQTENCTRSKQPPQPQLHRHMPEVARQVIPYMGDNFTVFTLKYSVYGIIMTYLLLCCKTAKYGVTSDVNKQRNVTTCSNCKSITINTPESNPQPRDTGVFAFCVLLLDLCQKLHHVSHLLCSSPSKNSETAEGRKKWRHGRSRVGVRLPTPSSTSTIGSRANMG